MLDQDCPEIAKSNRALGKASFQPEFEVIVVVVSLLLVRSHEMTTQPPLIAHQDAARRLPSLGRLGIIIDSRS